MSKLSISPILVMFKEYTDDQKGFNQAKNDGAVYHVAIDEASYSALYNVQQTMQATCNCLGADMLALGVARDGIYVSLSVIEDTELNPNIAFDDLEGAFALGLVNLKNKDEHLNDLRSQVDVALTALANGLPEGREQQVIDHCIQCVDGYKITVS